MQVFLIKDYFFRQANYLLYKFRAKVYVQNAVTLGMISAGDTISIFRSNI